MVRHGPSSNRVPGKLENSGSDRSWRSQEGRSAVTNTLCTKTPPRLPPRSVSPRNYCKFDAAIDVIRWCWEHHCSEAPHLCRLHPLDVTQVLKVRLPAGLTYLEYAQAYHSPDTAWTRAKARSCVRCGRMCFPGLASARSTACVTICAGRHTLDWKQRLHITSAVG